MVSLSMLSAGLISLPLSGVGGQSCGSSLAVVWCSGMCRSSFCSGRAACRMACPVVPGTGFVSRLWSLPLAACLRLSAVRSAGSPQCCSSICLRASSVWLGAPPSFLGFVSSFSVVSVSMGVISTSPPPSSLLSHSILSSSSLLTWSVTSVCSLVSPSWGLVPLVSNGLFLVCVGVLHFSAVVSLYSLMVHGSVGDSPEAGAWFSGCRRV